MLPAVLGGIFGPYVKQLIGSVSKPILDHFFPDTEERKQKEIELQTLIEKNKFAGVDQVFSLALEEIKNEDKYISRARPTIMWVMYGYVALSIPLGILYAFVPNIAVNIIEGVKLWLEAAPDSITGAFSTLMGVFIVSRQTQKNKIIQAKTKLFPFN